MEKTIEIPEVYEARIEGNKVILEPKESEDERIRKGLLEIFNKAQFGEWGKLKIKDIIAWLKRQKEQKPESCDCSRDEESYMNGIHHVLMNPEAYGLIKQKPTEWSEEDELTFQHCLVILHDYGYDSWLKSLRPQPHWKPSEEQMEALKDAFRKDGGNEYRKVINSLYCDLQKLL